MHHVQGSRGATLRARLLRRPAALLFHIAALVVVLDQGAKCAVVAYFQNHARVRLLGGALYVEEARNAGAAFSFATGSTIIFTGVAVIVTVTIARYAQRLRSLAWATCLGLVLGGAIGNLVDRVLREPAVLRGHVVDWISVGSFPVFNLADSGIVIGGVLGVLLSMRGVPLEGVAILADDDHSSTPPAT